MPVLRILAPEPSTSFNGISEGDGERGKQKAPIDRILSPCGHVKAFLWWLCTVLQ